MHCIVVALTPDCREPEKVFEGIEIEPALKESLLLNIKRRMTPKGTTILVYIAYTRALN